MAAARCTLYKPEIIEEVRRRFRSLPEPKPEEISKLEVVRALVVDIEELQKIGHSIQTIAETISAVGVPLTRATLKTYLGKLRPTARRVKRGRPRTSARLASTAPGAVVRVLDYDGEIPDRETRGVRRGTTTAKARQFESDKKKSSSTQQASASTEQVMFEQPVETPLGVREETREEVGRGGIGTCLVDRAQIAWESGENVVKATGRAMADGRENSPERWPVNTAVNRPHTLRQLRENAQETQNREADDGKDKSLDHSVPKPSTVGGGQAAHQVCASEYGHRNWTFIPREDTRDL